MITLVEENLEETLITHKSCVNNPKQFLVFEFGDYVILKVCLLSYNEIWGKKRVWFRLTMKKLDLDYTLFL